MGGIISEVDYKKFFERYRKFIEGLRGQRLEEFKKRFNQLKEFMGCIQTLGRKYEKETASQFNIFRVLGVERKEVKTHSAFIANLLDPQGNHGQGYLFLKEFYKILKKLNQEIEQALENEKFPNESDIEGGHWYVYKEYYIPNGRLDIAVMDFKNQYALIIENKIDAGDQEGQLEKYSEGNKGILIYLTIEGESYKPKVQGNPGSSKGNTDLKYLSLSYKQNIISWLDNSLRLISAPRLREILEQYLNLIRFL